MADQGPCEPKFFKYKRLADSATRGCAKGLGELAKAILAVQDGANLPMQKDLIPPFRMNENELSCQELTNFSSYDVVTLERRLDSLTRPWLVSLSNSGIPGQPPKRLILKPEEMGREACVMQTIVRFNRIWQERNIQVCGRVVCVKTYRIFPVAPDIGFVEFVMNSTTLQKLKRDSGSSSKASDRCMQYLEGDDEGLDERLNQLAATTVGYLAICYLLGIGDGHGDNLMLAKDGELFRIDFGFLFGEKPKGPDAPTLWLPRTVQKALGQRLENVIEVSKDAVRAVLERPNVNIHFSVFDAAFPKPSGGLGAAQFLASLNPEDYERQVVHIQDGSFGKAMKSLARGIGYGWKRCSTPALTINDKSPAALVFIVAGLDARLDALLTPETLEAHVEPLVDAPHVQGVWLRQAEDLFHAALLAGFVNSELRESLLASFRWGHPDDHLDTLDKAVAAVGALDDGLMNEKVQQLAHEYHLPDGPLDYDQYQRLLTEARERLHAEFVGALDHDEYQRLLTEARERLHAEFAGSLDHDKFAELLEHLNLQDLNLEVLEGIHVLSWLGLLGRVTIGCYSWQQGTMDTARLAEVGLSAAALKIGGAAAGVLLVSAAGATPAVIATGASFLGSMAFRHGLQAAFKASLAMQEDRVLWQALTDMGLPTTPRPSIQEVESQYVELHHWLHPNNYGSDDLFKQVNCAFFKAKSILEPQSRSRSEKIL